MCCFWLFFGVVHPLSPDYSTTVCLAESGVEGWGGGGGGEEGWDPGVTVGEYIMKHLHIIPLDCTADVQVCIVRPSLRAAE